MPQGRLASSIGNKFSTTASFHIVNLVRRCPGFGLAALSLSAAEVGCEALSFDSSVCFDTTHHSQFVVWVSKSCFLRSGLTIQVFAAASLMEIQIATFRKLRTPRRPGSKILNADYFESYEYSSASDIELCRKSSHS